MKRRYDYQNILNQAMENQSYAGFQNMGDIEKAIKYAKRMSFDVADEQQLRSLITKKDDVIWLIFFLRLKNKKDIVVFNKGQVKTCFHSNVDYLYTKPMKIMDFKVR
jgi:hypothetical protein